MVAAMVANGVPHIAKAMNLDPKTLRKFYRESLDHATVLLCARVAQHWARSQPPGAAPRRFQHEVQRENWSFGLGVAQYAEDPNK